MITDFMEYNDMFDLDFLIPTKEEMEETIKHITETGIITSHDEIVLMKMKLIKLILNLKGDSL